MAGLFDLLQMPDAQLGLQLLAAGGYSPTPVSAGQRIAGALQNFQQQQVSTAQQQLALQKATQEMQLSRLLASRFAGGGAPAAGGGGGGGVATVPMGGALSGAPGAGAGAGGGAGVAASSGGAGGAYPLSLNDIGLMTAMGMKGADNLFNQYKYATDGVQQVAGNYYKDPMTGAVRYLPKIDNGMQLNPDGSVTPVRGYLDSNAAIKGAEAAATEGAKFPYTVAADRQRQTTSALLTPGRPTIQPGGRMGGQSQYAEIYGAPPASSFSGLPAAQPGVTGSFQGDPAKVSAAIAGIADPQERANALAAFEQQMRTPGSTREVAGGGLEFSPAEKATQDADRARQVKTAEADVGRDTARLADIKTANRFLGIAKQVQEVFKDRPTDSGIGSMADSAGAFFGFTPPGAQAAARLKALGGWLVSNVPRMEGPQSNFDVANYQVMAADVANDKLPLDRRKAALDSITKMLENVANPDAAPLAPAGAAAASGGVNFRWNPSTRKLEKVQ